MNQTDESRGTMRISTGGEERMGCLGRLIVLFAVLAVVVLAAGVVAVRTDGARSLIEKDLGRRLGMAVSIERARIGWPYDLVVVKPVTESFDQAGLPGFRADELRLGLGVGVLWRVTVYRGVLKLKRAGLDRWDPEVFSRIGSLPSENIGAISRLTESFRSRLALTVSEGSIRWMDEEGYETVSAGGIAFRVSPVRLPSKKVYYHRLGVYSAVDADGVKVQDIEREWLTTPDADYLEISHEARSTAPSGTGFWGRSGGGAARPEGAAGDGSDSGRERP